MSYKSLGDKQEKWERRPPEKLDYGAADSIERVRAQIEPGRTYALRFTEVSGKDAKVGHHTTRTVARQYTAVRKYRYHVLMERRSGIQESFTYWELWKRVAWDTVAERMGA